MDKRSYFITALKALVYMEAEWVFSAFSVFDEPKDAWKDNPYFYRLVRENGKIFYVFKDDDDGGYAGGEQWYLKEITDCDPKLPLLNPSEKITINQSDVPNADDNTETTYGNVFLNYVCFIYPFGTKLKFKTGRYQPSDVEAMILERLEDTPPEGETRDQNKIYVDEKLRFDEGAFYLTTFTQLFIPAVSEKAITVDPAVIKLRNQLFAENKDKLTDPAVLANIEEKIIAADKESLVGDESEGFLNTSSKSWNIVRKKLFLLLGAEEGFGSSTEADPILKSLSEGWDVEKFDTAMSNIRAGAFDRGASTALAGELVKWLFRASSNIVIQEGDCGTKVGLPYEINDSNHKRLVGSYVMTDKGYSELTQENVKLYVGKKVLLRSPMFCKQGNSDFCSVCVGKNLSIHPTGASAAIANVGSIFLDIFLKAMHGKVLQVKKINFAETMM